MNNENLQKMKFKLEEKADKLKNMPAIETEKVLKETYNRIKLNEAKILDKKAKYKKIKTGKRNTKYDTIAIVVGVLSFVCGIAVSVFLNAFELFIAGIGGSMGLGGLTWLTCLGIDTLRFALLESKIEILQEQIELDKYLINLIEKDKPKAEEYISENNNQLNKQRAKSFDKYDISKTDNLDYTR